MGRMDAYLKSAQRIESEQPPDTLPKAEYPCEVVSLTLQVQEGTSKTTGKEYKFANGRFGLRVLDGPLKGQQTFINVNGKGGFPLTVPAANANLDANKRKMVNYYVQHAVDAIGLGLRMDPAWKRVEKPHPTSSGKTVTTFSGACLGEEVLLEIAASPDAIKDFEAIITGNGQNPCKGLFKLDTAKTEEGKEYQVFKGVRSLSDANLADWRTKQQTAPHATPATGSGIYAKPAAPATK